MTIQEAIGTTQGPTAQSNALYERLLKRRNSYEALVDALCECRQTGAVRILLQGYEKNSCS